MSSSLNLVIIIIAIIIIIAGNDINSMYQSILLAKLHYTICLFN